MTYQEENDILLESILERTFFSGWRDPENPKYANFRSLEIIMNYKCNLACKYCYVNRYGDKMYPKELYSDEEKLMNNLEMVLDWCIENKFAPRIEFFSGEALVQDIGHRAISRILDKFGGVIDTKILVPTNYTFILSDSKTKKVEELLEKGRRVGVPISLSASFDGKYCEANRPFKYNVESRSRDNKRLWNWEYKGMEDPRDDEYYDKCFAFAKKWGFGFHPMIYSGTIENWKQNFLWFQEMFKKHDIRWDNVYLLEVRNPEWTRKQIIEYGKFIEFLIGWSWNMVGRRLDNYFEFVFKGKGFNTLASPLGTIGRGIGCSVQSTMYLRLGDLALFPCHRQMYEPLMIGNLKVEEGRIVGVTAKNPAILVAELSTSHRNFPYCEQCTIKHICSGGCLGSQFETTGDPFTPIPIVCELQHERIAAMIRAYERIGILYDILDRIRPEKRLAFENIKEVM